MTRPSHAQDMHTLAQHAAGTISFNKVPAIAATRSTAIPEDYTDRPVPDDIAALYVAHVEKIDAWLKHKGASGYMDAGLADMLAEFAAAVRETQR